MVEKSNFITRSKKRKRCLTPEIFKSYIDSQYYYLGNMFLDSEDTLLQNKSVRGIHKAFERKQRR